jgi:hypothetical protein
MITRKRTGLGGGYHSASYPIFGRCDAGRRSGLAGGGERVECAGAVLTDQGDHRPTGVAEPPGHLRVGQALDEERAQCLVPAVVDLRGGR